MAEWVNLKAQVLEWARVYPWHKGLYTAWQNIHAHGPLKGVDPKLHFHDQLYFDFLLWVPWPILLIGVTYCGGALTLWVLKYWQRKILKKRLDPGEYQQIPKNPFPRLRLLAFLMILHWVAVKSFFELRPAALIAQDTPLKSYHTEAAPMLELLRPGQWVFTLNQSENLIRIVTLQGHSGWVNVSDLKPIRHFWLPQKPTPNSDL